jgi:hypothetical protein
MIPPDFPYRIVVQQDPNPDTLTSISVMTDKTNLVDMILIEKSRKISFAPKSLVSEMQQRSLQNQKAEQDAAANP